MKKHRGRHASGPSEGRYPQEQLHPRIEMRPRAGLVGVEKEEEKVTQFVLFGEPSEVPETRAFRVPVAEAHGDNELTGTLVAVALMVHGDGSTTLQVWGYDLKDVRAQWDIAVATIGGFRLSALPQLADVSEHVICTNCGGELHLDDPTCLDDWVHMDGQTQCAPTVSPGTYATPVRLIERTTTPANGTTIPPGNGEIPVHSFEDPAGTAW